MKTFGRIIDSLILIAFGLVCIGAASVAEAASGTAALTFTRPTTYVDGSALAATSITGYQVNCEFTPTGGSVGPCTFTGSPLPGGSATSGNVTLTYPASGGTACFTLATMVGANTSIVSSPKACKTLDAIAPNPPSNVTVTVTLSLNLSSATPITVAMAPPVVTKTP